MTSDQPQPEWLRNLRRDMRLEVRDMVGRGYVPEYYEQLMEPFVTMAAEYIKDAARHPDVYLDAKPTAIHHINGNPYDNHPENLEVVDVATHARTATPDTEETQP